MAAGQLLAGMPFLVERAAAFEEEPSFEVAFLVFVIAEAFALGMAFVAASFAVASAPASSVEAYLAGFVVNFVGFEAAASSEEAASSAVVISVGFGPCSADFGKFVDFV